MTAHHGCCDSSGTVFCHPSAGDGDQPTDILLAGRLFVLQARARCSPALLPSQFLPTWQNLNNTNKLENLCACLPLLPFPPLGFYTTMLAMS